MRHSEILGNDLYAENDEYMPLRDVALNKLRTAILRGDLPPGRRLMEITLANELGVSRTPVREAIRKLELEGLVVVSPRRGATVAGITQEGVKNVLEVRRALEDLAVELACERMTGEDVERLKASQIKFCEAIDTNDIMHIAYADEAFHMCIYEASYNEKLILILANLREQMYRYRLEYIKDAAKRQILLVEHDRILNALVNRDVRAAKQCMREHLDNQEITVTSKIKESE